MENLCGNINDNLARGMNQEPQVIPRNHNVGFRHMQEAEPQNPNVVLRGEDEYEDPQAMQNHHEENNNNDNNVNRNNGTDQDMNDGVMQLAEIEQQMRQFDRNLEQFSRQLRGRIHGINNNISRAAQHQGGRDVPVPVPFNQLEPYDRIENWAETQVQGALMDVHAHLEASLSTFGLDSRANGQSTTCPRLPEWPAQDTQDSFLKDGGVVMAMFQQEQPQKAGKPDDSEQYPYNTRMAQRIQASRLAPARLFGGEGRPGRRRDLPDHNRAVLHRVRQTLIAEMNKQKLETFFKAKLEAGNSRSTSDLLKETLKDAIQTKRLLKLVVVVDEFNANVNEAFADGTYPLDLVATVDSSEENYRMTNFLLLRGATMFTGNADFLQQVLQFSATNYSIDMLRLVLKIGADPDRLDQEGTTLLWRVLHDALNTQCHSMAFRTSKIKRAMTLVGFSKDLDRCYSHHKKSVLHVATEDVANKGLLMKLLENGANPLIADAQGKTPLMGACEFHRFSLIWPICESARENGQDILAQQDSNGKFPLHYIAVHAASDVGDQFEVIRYMLSNGNTLEDRCNEGKSILHYLCASAAHKDLLTSTIDLQKDADLLNHVDKQGRTLLHTACLHMRLPKVQYLLDTCPELFHAKDKTGRKPIHAALSFADRDGDRASLVQTLINHLECTRGTDREKTSLLNTVDNLGWTPLHMACFYGLRRAAIVLLNNGANIEAADLDGRRPLHLAFFSGCVKVSVKYGMEAELVSRTLIDKGTSEEVRASPLPMLSLSRALVHRGAETCAPDNAGNLPLFAGAMFGQVQACFWMIQAGTSQGLFTI